jgi:catechol 2,3-dioxygenase-like lactoylglutathione lyase family enzyme
MCRRGRIARTSSAIAVAAKQPIRADEPTKSERTNIRRFRGLGFTTISRPVKIRRPTAAYAHYRARKLERKDMTLKRMDNVLIVVDDLEAAKAFFIELGLKLEGETTVEGPLVGSLIGLKDVRATLAMMRTPDGQGIELDKFHTPNAIRFGPVDAPMNTLGIRRVMFAVDDIDAVVARMRAHGAELIGEMQYEDTYRLAYIRGPEGIIVALAEQLG